MASLPDYGKYCTSVLFFAIIAVIAIYFEGLYTSESNTNTPKL